MLLLSGCLAGDEARPHQTRVLLEPSPDSATAISLDEEIEDDRLAPLVAELQKANGTKRSFLTSTSEAEAMTEALQERWRREHGRYPYPFVVHFRNETYRIITLSA